MDSCYLRICFLFWLVTNVLKNFNMSMCLYTSPYTIDKNYFFSVENMMGHRIERYNIMFSLQLLKDQQQFFIDSIKPKCLKNPGTLNQLEMKSF